MNDWTLQKKFHPGDSSLNYILYRWIRSTAVDNDQYKVLVENNQYYRC